MSQTEKPGDVVKPLDNHASLVDENILTAAKNAKKKAATSEAGVAPQDNHASDEELTVMDNHASGERI
ncbi:hypothetical protein JK359_08210 [Streptomyces actinomycinicus]|uniref:Uncharacterized protein n=1 Tax=Streptomyces actinomycinicus TaxID=1695166 RepID=A0A937EFC8_9ACTN|nr:hypothetical protein [Streptomyces actinomycinicus]MBL1081967.1 hypothetical protein [Streptomyces actinomycinicus]